MNAVAAFENRKDTLRAQLEESENMPQAISAATMTLEQVACDLAQDEQDDFARQRQQAVMALAKRLPLGLRASRAKAQIVLEETQEQPSRVRRGSVGAGAVMLAALAVYEAVNGKMNFALLQALGALLMLFGANGALTATTRQTPRAQAETAIDAADMVREVGEICQAADLCAADLALIEQDNAPSRLSGTADEAMLARVRRRLAACQSDFALSAGEIGQIIEDHPMALIPQCVATERPDRAASFLAEGQIVVLTDGSPLALGAPSTLWHQLHTPDDASMRWQYGTFLRIVRFTGMLIHLFLPGAYIAVLRFHTELISPILLASVYETSSRVPAPIFLEALLMTLAFDLVSEAGLRAPGAMGNALGIVSGLILGQSAVVADIVSPLLLIVVAASGLGGFCIPNYALSVGMKIIQLLFLTAGALGGLYLMALLGLALLCAACAMRSVGSPLTAPLTPRRPGNPDLLIRFPLWRQKARAFFAGRKD